MADRGKAFEKELKDSMLNVNMMVERIPDATYWNGHRMVSKQTPADFHAYKASKRLVCFMVEAKATSTPRLDFARLEEHQYDALMEFDEFHEDAHGYVAVNFYDKVSIRRSNRCFMVPIAVWSEYKHGGKRKSLALRQCEEDDRVVECPRIGGSIFDMEKWIEHF